MRCCRSLAACAVVTLSVVVMTGEAVPQTHRNMLRYEVGQELGFGSLGRPVGSSDDQSTQHHVTPDTVARLRREASEGKSDSQYFLAILLYYGQGVPQDTTAAVSMFRQAAAGGHTQAMTNLGLILSGAPTPAGRNIAKDDSGAIAWLSRAAQSNDADAQWMFGRLHYDGVASNPIDYAQAFRLFSSSAAQGNPNGQYYRALLMEYGRGTPRNFKEAVKEYKKAAAQGHPEAMYNLGLMHYSGRGVPKSYSRSMMLFERASTLDHGPSCIMLATIHIYGYSVPIDYNGAKIWFQRALASNDTRVVETAQKGIDELTALLQKAELKTEETVASINEKHPERPQRLDNVRLPRTDGDAERQRKVAMAVADAQARKRAEIDELGKPRGGSRVREEL